VSHHFDSPTAIADGRINLCDLFVFPGVPGTSTLILTVNPDAGRSSATTFRPDALYEFVVASDGGTREDIAFRVTFTEPEFPYLSAPRPAELPALADLFGLREHRPE